MNLVVLAAGKAVLAAGTEKLVRRWTDAIAATHTVPAGVEIVPEDFGRFGAEWIRAGRPDESKVFLYFHGGGYFFGTPKLYRPLTWRLAAATRRPVLAIDYGLTPDDALIDALITYQSLLDRGYEATDIVLGGDSAGGHLVLATLLALKERGAPLPAAAVCISPWVDMVGAGESHATNRRSEYLLPSRKLARLGGTYVAGRSPDDPILAPLHGDYAGLPPLLLISSTAEILRDDSRTVAERARAAGVRVRHDEWEGMVHVFPLFAEFVPEGKAAVGRIADFLR
jgi:epsilon-lactone hydrolase